MKQFFSLLLLITATNVGAQNFEFGLNGGVGINSKPHITRGGMFIEELTPGKLTPAASLKAMYTHHDWQYGLSMDYRCIVSRSDNPLSMGPQMMPEMTARLYIFTTSETVIPIKLFVNRKLTWRHIQVYGGASAGYVFIANNQGKFIPAPESFTFNNSGRYGGSIGLQAGSTWYFTKRLGLNVEAALDYMHFITPALAYNVYSFPLTAGLRCRI